MTLTQIHEVLPNSETVAAKLCLHPVKYNVASPVCDFIREVMDSRRKIAHSQDSTTADIMLAVKRIALRLYSGLHSRWIRDALFQLK